MPPYGLAKLALLAWLALPQFRGAAFVYATYARPLLLALAEKAKEVPQLEPFFRDFAASVEKGAAKAAAAGAEEAYAPLKTHAQ